MKPNLMARQIVLLVLWFVALPSENLNYVRHKLLEKQLKSLVPAG